MMPRFSLEIDVEELALLLSGYGVRRASLAVQARKEKGSVKEATLARLKATEARYNELTDLLDQHATPDIRDS